MLALALAAACTPDGVPEEAPPPPLPSTPAGLVAGEAAYVANCAGCHGIAAAGTPQGPPLAHVVYEPSHHGDASFAAAVTRGVRAHHWRFGNMPPQPQVSPEQIEAITAYVRWVQRERGIE